MSHLRLQTASHHLGHYPEHISQWSLIDEQLEILRNKSSSFQDKFKKVQQLILFLSHLYDKKNAKQEKVVLLLYFTEIFTLSCPGDASQQVKKKIWKERFRLSEVPVAEVMK
ncbi:hypothetical protein PGTUg99_003405 [Puccinia graminis f. sp. tritici]|uniref:Uncharacterized protein n=1 Tax=Puccinia graminis f. sp. tritici TaxID=56615 RepID=A0A5B0RSE2_PUCGR|nr:hypothetical protein PGTUg99_003405 [Puccinia graminis f. sp. tritici]